jgi:hypothetical protein
VPDDGESEEAEENEAGKKKLPWPLIIGGGALVLVGVVGTLVFALGGGKPKQPNNPITDNRPPGGELPPVITPGQRGTTEPTKPPDKPPPKPDGPPKLYRPALPLDAVARWQETIAPWAKPAPVPADAAVLAVNRMPPPPGAERRFASLPEACAAAAPGRVTVIEIDDNGPVFCPPAEVEDRSLVVRAGKGYRPLLVCDPGAAPAGRTAFLSVSRGSLTLENVDVVVQWPDAPDGAALVRVAGGDFQATGCSFSAAGKPRAGLDLVRLEGAEPKHRARLSRCLVRGAALTVLDLQAPGAEALVDGCLAVGGDQPLFQVTARNDPPTTLRVVRSTLVGRQTGVRLVPASAGDTKPAFAWRGWDALVSRANAQTGGELLLLENGATTEGVEWSAVNCLYAGWRTLLAGPEPVAAGNVTAWRERWRRIEGDVALTEPWPAAEYPDPGEVPPDSFRTEGTPAGFAATSGEGWLGADLAALPPARDNWRGLANERFAVPLIDHLTPGVVPDIPPGDAGTFTGASLTLTANLDLGDYLQKVQRMQRLGPRVVLHLSGSGSVKTSPVRVEGTTLVLYFQPPKEKAAPLVLTPANGTAGKDGALIEVENGSLEIDGGAFAYPNYKTAAVPPFVLKVSGGDLRLHGCRLDVPLVTWPDAFRGLVAFAGNGKADLDAASTCAFRDCVLLSPGLGFQVAGPGARLGLQGCLLLAGGDGLHLSPATPAGPRPAGDRVVRPNLCCTLEQTTVAARRAAVLLGDLPEGGEPVVVQTRGTAFLNPFTEGKPAQPARAGLVLCKGEALPRGLLVWQGEGDFYDKRLAFGAAPADGPAPEQPPTVWARLWGTPGLAQAVTDVAPSRVALADLDKPQLELLVLQASTRFKGKPPGIEAGLLKKPAKP